MIILSNSLVLSEAEEAFPDGTPWIGWHDLVEITNITSTTEDASFPVTNLSNVATHLIWQGTQTAGDEYITVVTNYSDDIDYVGIARHNFGSGAISVQIESSDDSYTKTLLHFDGGSGTTITDSSAGEHVWTAAGNAVLTDITSVFGGSSLECDGTGDYITTPDHADFALGSGDFTIDCRFNRSGGDGTIRWICGQADNALTATTRTADLFLTAANVVQFTAVVGGVDFNVTGTTAFTTTGWHHVAGVRTGNTLKLFIDGVQEGGDVAIAGTVNNSSNAYSVGRLGEFASNTWFGSLDEFRLSVGIARWTSAFTVPDAPHGELVQETMPSNDWPIIARFTPQALSIVRIRLHLNGTAPQAAVIYIGKLLVLERSITIGRGHVPINYGRRTTIVNGMSESGNFLGRIVIGEHRQSKAEFEWFTPDFYRSDIDEFLEAAQELPFFWAWHPETYPSEVGYCWLTNNAEPEVDPVTQRVALTLEMRGIA